MKWHKWGRKPPVRKPFNWMMYTAIYSGSAGFIMMIIAVAFMH